MSKRELQSEVQHQRLEAQVTDLTAKNAELTAKNEDLTAEVETLTADRERQAGSLKKNLVSINELTAKVTELEENAARLTKKDGQQTVEMAILRKSNDELEKEIADMREDYAAACKELEGHGLTLLSSDDGLQVIVTDATRERIAALTAERDKLRDECDGKTVASTVFEEKLCARVDSQRQQIATLEREKGEALDAHNDALATITRLQDTIALLEAQLADGTDADDTHLQTIANLSEDVSMARLDVRVYRIAVRDYATRLSHMRDARDAAVKERDAARDTAKALQGQLATLAE